MAINENDLHVLQALAIAREEHQELADLLDFYHDLYQVQFGAKASLPEPAVNEVVIVINHNSDSGVHAGIFGRASEGPPSLVS